MSFLVVLAVQIILIVFLPLILTGDKWLYQKVPRDEFRDYVPASIIEMALISCGLWLGWVIAINF